MTPLRRPCLDCGEPTDATRCEQCRPRDPQLKSTRERGYGTTWRKLSERARRLQPWCTDCGTVNDLTADHSPEAWQRYEAGKTIRLDDIEVVCRPCNSRRGKARGDAPSHQRTDCRGSRENHHTPGSAA